MMRQKDFPREIEIAPGVYYKVKFKRGLESKGYMGLAIFDDQEIWISMGLSPKERLSTFFHEVAHCLDEHYGLKWRHRDIYKMEEPLAFFFARNAVWIKWI